MKLTQLGLLFDALQFRGWFLRLDTDPIFTELPLRAVGIVPSDLRRERWQRDRVHRQHVLGNLCVHALGGFAHPIAKRLAGEPQSPRQLGERFTRPREAARIRTRLDGPGLQPWGDPGLVVVCRLEEGAATLLPTAKLLVSESKRALEGLRL